MDNELELLKAERDRRNQLSELKAERDRRQSSAEEKPHPWGGPEGSVQSWSDLGHEVQNVAGGAADTFQRGAAGALEAGEWATRKGAESLLHATGHPDAVVPKWNAREAMGLEGDNQVSLKNMIAHDPNSVSSQIGAMLPHLAAGGASVLRQAAAAGIDKLLTGEPGEKSKLGELTGHQGRVASAIQALLTYGIGGKAAEKSLPYVVPLAKKYLIPGIESAVKSVPDAYKYITPGRDIKKVVNEIGAGKTSEQNIEEISKRLQFAKNSSESEALAPKLELIAEHGTKPVGSLKEGDYFKTHDLEPGPLGEEPPLDKISKDISKNYSLGAKEAHKDYVKNPSFENADKLSSKLFKDMQEIKSRKVRGMNSGTDDTLYEDMMRKRNAIMNDQEKFIKTLPEEDQGKYAAFKRMWTEHAKKYEDPGAIRDLANKNLDKMTSAKVGSSFRNASLSPKKMAILKDIGPSGLNNTLYHQLIGMPNKDVRDFARGIKELEEEKGFQNIITPEMKKFASRLSRRQNMVDSLQSLLGGAVGGLVGGPYGMVAGALAPKSIGLAKEVMKKLMVGK